MPNFFNQGPSWKHTHAIAAATTDPDFIMASGAVANVTADDVPANGSCGAVGCNGNHPIGATTPVTNIVQASGAAKSAVVTAIPAVTGAAQ